jgi:hypothetical protein
LILIPANVSPATLEVVEVFDSNVFYTKVIYDEAELDGTPFVVPETKGGFSFIVAFSKKAGW